MSRGVSVIARRHNVNANQVFTWRWEFREAACAASFGRLVPVAVNAPCDGDVHASAGPIKIALPGGARVIVDWEMDDVTLARVGTIEGDLCRVADKRRPALHISFLGAVSARMVSVFAKR